MEDRDRIAALVVSDVWHRNRALVSLEGGLGHVGVGAAELSHPVSQSVSQLSLIESFGVQLLQSGGSNLCALQTRRIECFPLFFVMSDINDDFNKASTRSFRLKVYSKSDATTSCMRSFHPRRHCREVFRYAKFRNSTCIISEPVGGKRVENNGERQRKKPQRAFRQYSDVRGKFHYSGSTENYCIQNASQKPQLH